MTDSKKTKAEIRELMKKKRSAMTFERILVYSEQILRKLVNLPEYIEADALLCYVSFSSEVDTHFLINKAVSDGKKVYVPKVFGKESMEFYRINDINELSAGNYGILEPDETKSEELSMVHGKKYLLILPGVAFDKNFTRLGYGGGYYDRFLAKYVDFNINKVMLAYESEKTEYDLPREEYDIPADVILTEINEYRR